MYTSKYIVGVSFLSVLSGFGQASLVDNFDPLNPSSEGCVNPKGFNAGLQQNLGFYVDCGERCKDPQSRGSLRSETECLSGCRDIHYMNTLETWVEDCWNRVYSCEYQITAVKFLGFTSMRQTASGGIPFYPPPGDAKEGACSCNLGYIEGNQTASDSVMASSCLPFSFGAGDINEARDCFCCAASQYASAQNICPNSNLDFISVSPADMEELKGNLEGSNQCSILDSNPGACQSTYNFSSTGVAPVNPFKLPQAGTEALSNLPGNAFTAYVTSIITVAIDGYSPKTLKLAPWDSKAAAATGTGTGTGTGKDANGGAAGTGTAAGGASPTGNSAGSIGVPNMIKWVGGFAAVMFWGLW